MAHFVNNPPDKVKLTEIAELNLLDPNGTATVCVWGMPIGKESMIKTEDGQSRFDGTRQRVDGNFSYYYCRGLRPGEKIAAFFIESKNDVRRHTSWLPVKRVAAFRSNPQPSRHKPNFTLDSYGSEQRHPAVKEQDWRNAVEQSIANLLRHPIGKAVLDGLTGPQTIKPYVGSKLSADDAISYTPQACNSWTPGGSADEVLLHELIHCLEDANGGRKGYVDIPVPQLVIDGVPYLKPSFEWDGSDFLTITATNVYASSIGRKLRHDHGGLKEMDQPYVGSPAIFRVEQLVNFVTAQGRVPTFITALAASPARWNPFKAMPAATVGPVAPIPPLPKPGGPSTPIVPTVPKHSVLPATGGLISIGHRGPEVTRIQVALNGRLRPSPKLIVDGDFGPATDRAVRDFQRQSRLTPDGVVGQQTRTALGI